MLATLDEIEQRLAEVDAELSRRNEPRWERDPWAWLTECAYTVDEASQRQVSWPDWDYVHDLVECLQTERLVAIPKSRRMFASWTVSGWITWLARFHPYHAVFVQSENESKAAYLLDKRCRFIEEALPAHQRRRYAALRTNEGLVGRMTYERTGSYLWAVPQGDSVIRAFTFSVLVADEMEFQPKGHEAFMAALPIVEKGARMILLSSSNGPGGVIAGLCREVGFARFR